MAHGVVGGHVYPRQPRYALAPKLDSPRIAHEVDVRSRPAPIVQLPQVVGGLVVAANCRKGNEGNWKVMKEIKGIEIPQAVGGLMVATNVRKENGRNWRAMEGNGGRRREMEGHGRT